MSDDILKKGLWTPRPVNETLQIYADWADQYDADVNGSGYATPMRVAQALADVVDDMALPVLDFGCGTGLSGHALAKQGFSTIDGVDISPDMLTLAQKNHGDVYRKLWQGQAGEITGVAPGAYHAIIAAGVISLGAAPPETLNLCLDHLGQGGLLAFSFNDPTLEEGSYDAALSRAVDQGRAQVIFREHGPHLPGKGMGSDVIVIRRP